MSTPTFVPPPVPSGGVPHGWAPQPPASSGARVHAGIALGVIAIVGFFGSVFAFFCVAFMGDACGFSDSPAICTAPAAVSWGLMLLPGLATLAGITVAAVGLGARGRRPHAWPVAAWLVWVGGGVLWIVALGVLGSR